MMLCLQRLDHIKKNQSDTESEKIKEMDKAITEANWLWWQMHAEAMRLPFDIRDNW